MKRLIETFKKDSTNVTEIGKDKIINYLLKQSECENNSKIKICYLCDEKKQAYKIDMRGHICYNCSILRLERKIKNQKSVLRFINNKLKHYKDNLTIPIGKNWKHTQEIRINILNEIKDFIIRQKVDEK